ncbi:PREDICTED: angiopoietin-2-like [Branchiostoma belcheri]|uniref:Angiopoietin-2-like n=1 Tax=Branchiostoma belcheri TaxID=7741 RepID=A0A6P4Z869_BRABE|nr:PREDICTED: angiopoietin-2-like [Branchiostoma belcheri]
MAQIGRKTSYFLLLALLCAEVLSVFSDSLTDRDWDWSAGTPHNQDTIRYKVANSDDVTLPSSNENTGESWQMDDMSSLLYEYQDDEVRNDDSSAIDEVIRDLKHVPETPKPGSDAVLEDGEPRVHANQDDSSAKVVNLHHFRELADEPSGHRSMAIKEQQCRCPTQGRALQDNVYAEHERLLSEIIRNNENRLRKLVRKQKAHKREYEERLDRLLERARRNVRLHGNGLTGRDDRRGGRRKSPAQEREDNEINLIGPGTLFEEIMLMKPGLNITLHLLMLELQAEENRYQVSNQQKMLNMHDDKILQLSIRNSQQGILMSKQIRAMKMLQDRANQMEQELQNMNKMVKGADKLDQELNDYKVVLGKLQLKVEQKALFINHYTGKISRLQNRLESMTRDYSIRYHDRVKDCASLYMRGYTSSHVYTIPTYQDTYVKIAPTQLYCDMDEGGGWTVIQRRFDGSVRFNRTWDDYQHGFGTWEGEFYLGNDKIHKLTNMNKYMVRFVVTDWKGEVRWAEYDEFRVENESTNYRAHVGKVSSDHEHGGQFIMDGAQFSTFDKDNDSYEDGNCAKEMASAGWFSNCGISCNWNGKYYKNGQYQISGAADGMWWWNWHGVSYSLKAITVKIRPVDFDH